MDQSDMPVLAQAVIAAANAAAQAAQAAASSGGTAGPGAEGAGGSQGVLKRGLAKLIPRPGAFNPTDREQEVLQWRDWYWTVEQYLVVVDAAFQDELEKLEANLTTEIDWELLDEGEQQRSRFLYSLLGSLVQGRLTGVIKNVEKFNGMEALRQLLMNCQPQARNRTMNLLQGIMSYPSFNMKSSLLPQILKLEEHYVQYERLGGKLSPDMKSAVLLRAVSGQMKTQLNLTLNEGSSYNKIREAIIAFDTATTKWNESGALTFSGMSPMTSAADPNGPMPMEIDRIKGDGKKGKGKGGKPSGKEGKGKGGGKESKGGKGKSANEVCWTCGKPGHMSRDCWRIRQVEAPAVQSVAGSHTTSPSTTLTTSTSSGGGGDTNMGAKNIRRVSQPVIFDLREASEAGSIRVVSQVEFFNIASEDEEEDGCYQVNTIAETENEEEVEEAYVTGEEQQTLKVIVDSGADASIFPGRLMGMTRSDQVLGQALHLQDAQGKKIQSYGNKDVDILMMTSEGQSVVLKERVTFSDMVSQPIWSFGRLMRSGWSIDGQRQCLRNGSLEVPLAFQNRSLVVDASIRVITEPLVIRTLAVRLNEELKNMAGSGYGWEKKDEFWVGLHLSTRFQSPQFIPGFRDQGEGMCRTTLVEKQGSWELVEMANRWMGWRSKRRKWKNFEMWVLAR